MGCNGCLYEDDCEGQCSELNNQLERVSKITDVSKLTLDELIAYVGAMKDAHSWDMQDEYNTLQRASELWDEETMVETKEDCYLTIEQLKKQIKYSKHPLEIKMLNKKLNQMYKEMKRR